MLTFPQVEAKNCQQEKTLITAIYLCTPGPPAKWPYVTPVTGHMTIWTYFTWPYFHMLKIVNFRSPISIWRRAPCQVAICHTSIGSHPMGLVSIYEVENCSQELWWSSDHRYLFSERPLADLPSVICDHVPINAAENYSQELSWSSDHRYLFGARPPAELPYVTRLITSLTGSSSWVGNRNWIPWLLTIG